MKNTPAAKKAPKEPRIECHQTVYTEAALQMWEQATGQKYARAPKPMKPVTTPTDAD